MSRPPLLARAVRTSRCVKIWRPMLELLEARVLLASDFGDTPLPYPTLLAESGAEHIAIGPTLGANRDTEADGVHSAGADGDDNAGSPDDEDGVTFGTIQVGQVVATLTVNVAGGSAMLDAWVDFNGDGAWGGPLEQIADRVAVAAGNNTISFDVPSWAADGTTYARFRLSTAGNLGVGGAAADGEVEDYAVMIDPPKATSGKFGGQKTISTAADTATSVFAADVDGDGDTDVLSASRFDDKIAWYENDGNQNFTAHIISTAANGAMSVFAADVDGDGDTDVLSASQYDSKIAWYENDGSQNFTTHIISTAANGATSVFAADVDGDGDTDVLSASRYDGKIAWYENDGSQNFTAQTISTAAAGAYSVFAADVDGDGDTDVLSASYADDKIAWYENDGSQNFTAHTINISADFATSVYAADVDGDGDTDVLSASSYFAANKIAWYENDGSQSFIAHTISTAASGARSVFAADVDGDGDTDVLSASTFDDKIVWYKNDGSQNFTTHIISTAANGAMSVFAADVDSDGDLDVLSASQNDDKIAWYENLIVDFGDAPVPYPTLGAENGAEHLAIGPTLGANRDFEADGVHATGADGDDNTGSPDDEDGVTFGTIRAGQLGATLTVDVAGGSAKLDAWIDFNGDGAWGGPWEQIADRVAMVAGNNTITFDVPSWAADGTTYARFRLSTAGNLGVSGTATDGEVEDYAVTIAPPKAAAGKFGSQHTISTSEGRAVSVFAADVDGDGDTDVVSGSRNDNKIAWHENDGSQNFTTHIVTTGGAFVLIDRYVFAADVDGDGDTDVLSADQTGEIAWYENDGSQNFTAHIITTAGAINTRSVFAADMDGDGDIDVFTAAANDDSIYWYENDGNQNFLPYLITEQADEAASVFAADVDGDGDLDVLSASTNDDKIAWYKNDGSQNFTTYIISTALDRPLSVFAADVDGDGDTDVLASFSSINGAVAWYENDGNQSFTVHVINTAGYLTRSVFAADMDGDGDTDVLAASTFDDKIAWYKNDGSQNFTAYTISTAADGPRSVFAADVDGDGDLDVLSASYDDDKIAWYENVEVDFGDAPLPYPTLLAENGAEHTAVGPTLGGSRDSEANGAHSPGADSDDTTGIGDEDGVTFGPIQVGQVGATLTVNVAGGSAKLDAWIDFNGDGAWGGPLEQVADRVTLVTGDNTIAFDVPSWAADGTTYARFRLSTAGNLGVGGTAADGEVEDYAVTIAPPKAAAGNFGSQKTINTAANGASSVFAADVDGDGDTDVLSASGTDDTIIWYENDGNQNLTAHTISAVANGASSVFAADVDGDGDTDVLSASFFDDQIAWYKNDGSQNFTTHTISTAANGALSVFAADVDGDGDIDVLSASELDDKIAWYENDGSQNFTTHTISTATIDTRSVFAADVDGDGDTDVLSASFDKIAWYENDSSQNFTAHTISTAVSWAQSVLAADVDGDGDTDILSASYFDDKIDWYENDASQNFTAHTITTAANGARSVFAADVDGDGDTDVLSASNGDDKIAWYENDGSQNFTTHTISNAANGAISVFAADVDGDGDLDVLSASLTDDKIAWYENRVIHFGVSAPGSVTAGTSFNITVTALNENDQPTADYLGTVHFTSSDAQANLPTDYTFTVVDQGVHTFTVTLKISGSQTVTVTDTADVTITGNAAIQVNAAAAAAFELTATVTSIAKGKPFNVTLTAYDAFQNVATGYTGTVHCTSSDAPAVLPADYAFVSGDQGVHTFSVTLKTLGNQSVTATDTANGLLTDSLTILVVRADKAPLTPNPTPPPTPLPIPIPAPPGPFAHTRRQFGAVTLRERLAVSDSTSLGSEASISSAGPVHETRVRRPLVGIANASVVDLVFASAFDELMFDYHRPETR